MDLRLITILILAVAALLRSEIFFYLLYLLVGLQALAWLWVRQSTGKIVWQRDVPTAAFPNEPVEITITVRNDSLLPIPWLALHESVPASLRTPPAIRQVIALGAREQRVIRYLVEGRRRGLYRIGPLTLRSGDVFGLHEQTLAGGQNGELVIYPTVLPLPELGLPAALPFGARPSPHSLFVDPARPIGVRAYAPGDSVRQIDWKSSARVGGLQVRRHEPAIARETLVALAFSQSEYPGRYTYDSLERAVVAAASIAADQIARRQPVGLCASGLDPITGAPAAPLPIASGRGHLIELLRLLGRLEAAPSGDIVAALSRAAALLGWGSSVVLVTHSAPLDLIERLLPLQRRGLSLALILVEGGPSDLSLARQHQIAAYLVGRSGRPEEA